jgi:hypothetical protein
VRALSEAVERLRLRHLKVFFAALFHQRLVEIGQGIHVINQASRFVVAVFDHNQGLLARGIKGLEGGLQCVAGA